MARRLKVAAEETGTEASVKTGVVLSERKNHSGTVIFVLSVLLAMALGIAGYFYYQYVHSPQKNVELGEVEAIVKEIGKFMELPEGEATLATVTDKTKLADQAFFKKAENGDKILIYATGGKAILYRPSQNKVIDVTAINVQDDAATDTSLNIPSKDTGTAAANTETAMQPAAENTAPSETDVSPTVALYNGSTKIGVTNTTEDKIIAKFPNVTVEKKEKAGKNNYTDTLVIDLSGKNADLARNIAETIGGTVADVLPDGEVAAGTDILIIVGNK